MIFATRAGVMDDRSFPPCSVAPPLSQRLVPWQIEKQLVWSSNWGALAFRHKTTLISTLRGSHLALKIDQHLYTTGVTMRERARPWGIVNSDVKVNKRLGNVKKFLQHEGNGFRSWQLTFEKQIPLLFYGFRLNSTISIKFQFYGQKSLIVCFQWLNSSNHCNFSSG